ncbi:MAG: NADPH:quinone oxidoreductase family protein [Rhodospirillaceae bacterium]|nr:NADPH:quinone oxidoreductase family protein [Rhodospirillaceae bacterium]
MKAIICSGASKPEDLRLVEKPSLSAGAGQVVIKVAAAGVNFGDSLIIKAERPASMPQVFTPGYEVAGTIHELGDGVVGFTIGDRVMAFCFTGGYAEEVAVEWRFVYPLPDAMDFPAAAGFLAVYGTAYYALHERAHLQPEESLLVLGAAGGAGLAAIEVGAAMGARVIAGASSAAKLELCSAHGAVDIVNYAAEDLPARMLALTDSKGVDVLYDVWGHPGSDTLVPAMANEGRYLIIGFAGGGAPKFNASLLLYKEVAAIGVYWGQSLAAHPMRNRDNIAKLLDWYQDGKLKPSVSETDPLKDAARAMQRLLARDAKGKVVLITG